MIINFELGDKRYKIELPEETTVLSMNGAANVSNPSEVIKESLSNPIGCESYFELVKRKLKEDPQGEAVIVISDNTRPVPYRGEQGILLPLVKGLLSAGAVPEQITILCANGTHIPLEEDVFRKMLDPALFELGVKIVNHDCLDDENLKFLGYSKSGDKNRNK